MRRLERTHFAKFIDEDFPTEPFTSKQVRARMIERFGYIYELPKDVSATVCGLVARGFLERTDEKSPDDLIMYKRTAQPLEPGIEYPSKRTIVTPSDNDSKETVKAIKKRSKRIFNQAMVYDMIQEHFPFPKVFTSVDVAEILGMPVLYANNFLARLNAKGLFDLQLFKGASGTKMWKLKNPNQTENPEQAKNPDGVENPEQSASPIAKDESTDKNGASEPPGVEMPERIPLTEEMYDVLDIPLSVIGKAMLMELRDYKRTINTLKDTIAGLERENKSLRDRIGDQFKNISKLNELIAKLNTEKPRGSSDSMTKLSEIARFGNLRKGSAFNPDK